MWFMYKMHFVKWLGQFKRYTHLTLVHNFSKQGIRVETNAVWMRPDWKQCLCHNTSRSQWPLESWTLCWSIDALPFLRQVKTHDILLLQSTKVVFLTCFTSLNTKQMCIFVLFKPTPTYVHRYHRSHSCTRTHSVLVQHFPPPPTHTHI